MKSGETHCTHELASEVRQGGGGGRRRKRRKTRKRRKRRKRRKDVLIKSNNPHLTGVEKKHFPSRRPPIEKII